MKGAYVMDEFNYKQMAQDLARIYSGLQNLKLQQTKPNVNILADSMNVIEEAFRYFNIMATQSNETDAEPETAEKE